MNMIVTSRRRSPVRALRGALHMLARDKFALVAACFLTVLVIAALIGPVLLGSAAEAIDLRARNAAPTLNHGWLLILGADTLGRSLLARLVVGCRITLQIASSAVLLSMLTGSTLGLVAGYFGGWTGTILLRLADVLMSFPSMLLALIVLYVLGPSIENLVIVLAITRIPVYLRTTRAEILELRERMFVQAARASGASNARIIFTHIVPLVLPTLATIAAIDFAAVILTESGLSFLGLGIQPPEFTWGAMVATGRNYLSSAWWLSLWPGLAIMLTTLALNLIANWARTVGDPNQRWRVEARGGDN